MNESRFRIFDGHNDSLLDFFSPFGDGKPSEFFEGNDKWQLDLPKARRGNFGGGFFAVYIPGEDFAEIAAAIKAGDTDALASITVPVPYEDAAYPALQLIAILYRLEAVSQGQFQVVRTAAEMASCFENNQIAALFHFEGAEAIDTDLNALEVFYQAGLRSVGIVHSRNNHFGHGVPMGFGDSPDNGPGLTEAGIRLVRRCNDLGVMIDVSHLNYKGFWDVANHTGNPIVATHSCAYHLCNSPRNLMDDQLDAIAQTGGMVGANFFIGFLNEEGSWDQPTPVSRLVEHIDYMVERMGIDHVGFGSDYGVIPAPIGMPDISTYPVLMDALRERGYDDEALHKLAHGNWLRVVGETWAE